MPTSFDFDADAVPDAWQTRGGGSVTLTRRHAKRGEQSLRWSWKIGGTLLCREPVADPHRHPRAGLEAWVYNEKPIDGELHVLAGSLDDLQEGRGAYEVPFRLDFRGWRMLRASLQQDSRTPAPAGPRGAVEAVAFRPPAGVPSGELFFDLVELVDAVPPRSADWQMPYFLGEHGGWWKHAPLLASREQPRRPLPESVSPADREAIATIRKRYETWLLGNADRRVEDLPEATREQLAHDIEAGRANYESLGLRREEGGVVKGPGLFMGRKKGTFYWVFYNVMLPLAFDFTLHGTESARDAAIRLFDYVHDQGWAAGSACGSLALNGLQMAAYCHSLYLLREELDRTGRLETHLHAAWWYLSFGKAFAVQEPGYQETNADELRCTVFDALPVVLAMPESPRQTQYLRSWWDWLHDGLRIAPRFAGVLKPDGIGWHHRGVYCGAYTGEAYEFSALAMHLIRQTPYEAEPWAVANLAEAARTQYLVARDYAFPHALRGRMLGDNFYSTEQPQWYGMCAVFAYLSTVPGPHAEEMAGLFARLWNPRHPLHEDAMRLRMYNDFRCMETPGRRTLLESVADTRPEPAPAITGCWVKPWAGLAIARGETWSVAIKGWSQYVWDFECHPAMWSSVEQNVFSRFISNGTLQVTLEPSQKGADDVTATPPPGAELDHGWDWSRWPGSTTTHLPLDRLYHREESWQNRWFSDETFLGGVGGVDGHAVFAVKLHDTCHDPSFRATKSWFVFDHEIVCLGSGIACDDEEHATQTTLFQCYLPDAAAMPIEVDGEAHASLPWHMQASENTTRILDPYRNGFVVPGGQPLHVARQHQTSRDANNTRDTAGSFAVAWIDHGPAPSDQGYEYAMLLQTTPQQLAAFADDPPYRVLQRDEHAHIVQHTRHDAIGYAVFTAEREIVHGPLARTDTPVTAFAKPMTDGGLLFRVADPDLRLPRKGNLGFLTPEDEQQLREPHRVRLLLRDRWFTDAQTTASLHKYNDNQTLLEWEAADGLPLELNLRPLTASRG